eukprot:gnl/MRDRNA2_/MRDRNA2_17904_c0_seq1.p1 gnl/MRDRNA2_/MRDRNA2_17904_c0~~gnl/MRDRNA2_/MRDRNA2_17904_c0_seq1.p1  ORF type:complete len:565 (+),score=90.64 gnl/MRDRNA2_/MRDRNA2_17904_c0_seq1:130-1824(+)
MAEKAETDPLLSGKKLASGLQTLGKMYDKATDVPLVGPALAAPLGLALWVGDLAETYGAGLLILLFSSQHVLKGFVRGFCSNPESFLYKSYGVAGPLMQVYQGVAMLPWSVKPIIGLCSDLFPINGYHKGPYIIIAAALGMAGICTIGYIPQEALPIYLMVLCLFFKNLLISAADLLTEAKYAEQMSAKPEKGPDLMTFVWGGMEGAAVISLLLVGPMITVLGPKSPYMIAAIPAAFIFWPLGKGYLGEKQKTQEEIQKTRDDHMQNIEAFILCVLMLAATLTMSIAGMCTRNSTIHFCVALGVFAVILTSFSVLLRPDIAKVNALALIQGSFRVSIGGAAFYFYTDTPEMYPEGPHFSTTFYTSVMGLVGAGCSVVGFWSYRKYLREWTFQNLLLIANIAVAVLNLCDVLLYSRLNVKLGIPDTVFVLGSEASTTVISTWMSVPNVVLMSQLCPRGLEATMYALLAGCHNLGSPIGQYFGAFMLTQLGIKPSGAPNESHQFENLWKASLISSTLPCIAIALIPFMIPNVKQNEKVLQEDETSATAGSLWKRFMGQDKKKDASV